MANLRASILVALLLFTSAARAGDDWTPADSWREGAYLALHLTDWAQTRNIARNPDQWRETNRLLGEHPSVGRVNRYFVITAAAQIGIAVALSKGWRAAFQYGAIAHDAWYVTHNFSIGISARF